MGTLQAPIVDDVKDEKQVQISRGQIFFLSQDRADITFAVNELCQKMSDPPQHSFAKLKRLVRYLKGEAMDSSFQIRGHEFRSDSFL